MDFQDLPISLVYMTDRERQGGRWGEDGWNTEEHMET